MLRMMSLFCCISLAASSLAQQTSPSASQSTKSSSTSNSSNSSSVLKDFEQFAPYWTCESGWHTELQLRNNLSSDTLTVRPSLRQPDGTETALASVTILPGEVQSIDVMDVLNRTNSPLAGAANAYGSVVFRYTAKAKRNLYASVMVHEMGRPIMYHLDAVNQAPKWHVGSREGVWWLPTTTVSDYLVLTNQANHGIAGVLNLYDSTGKVSSQPMQLAGRQILRLSVRDLVQKAGFSSTYGGIQIAMTENAGSLDTVHILYDETVGFSATMKMFDRDPSSTQASHDYAGTGDWITRAPMLALMHPDPALAFPPNTVLHPMVFVRNASLAPAHVTAELHWRSPTWSGVASLPSFVLAPEEVTKLDISEVQRNGTIPTNATWAQVSLITDAAPDDVTAVAASYDSTLRYGAQTPFSDQLSGHLEGGEWRVDTNHNSIIAAGNGGGQAVSALLTLRYNGGRSRYELRKLIAAHDQWFINLGDLIRSGVPDANGTLLPADLASGAYSLQEDKVPVKNWLFEGKVITDKTYGHATYGCMICCGYGGDAGPVGISPSPAFVGVGSSGDFNVYGDNACNGDSTNLDGYMSSSSSDNTAIITVSSLAMTGVAVGRTSINASLSRVPSGDGEDQRTPCPVESMAPTAPASVPPQLSISPSLWFFGSGISTPSGFTLGSTQATITASGASGGTYSWTITNGTTKASFSAGSSVSSTTTSSNTVTIYSIGASTSSNDVTVQLSWTPQGESASASSLQLGIDSPYTMVSAGAPSDYSVGLCSSLGGSNPTPGTYGWLSLIPYNALSMFGQLITNLGVNETLLSATPSYQGENWPLATASGFQIPSSGQFEDDLCTVTTPPAPTLTPPALVPQSTLTNVLVYTRPQIWRIGSLTVGSATEVQTDTQQYFQDHGRHVTIVSPTQ